MPNSWKLVMLPLPRTRFRLMTVKPLFPPPNSLSSRFTSASPLLPFSGPSPGPSAAVPTWPLWQIEQVTPMLPLQRAVRVVGLRERHRQLAGAAVGEIRVLARQRVGIALGAERRAVAFGDELVEIGRPRRAGPSAATARCIASAEIEQRLDGWLPLNSHPACDVAVAAEQPAAGRLRARAARRRSPAADPGTRATRR